MQEIVGVVAVAAGIGYLATAMKQEAIIADVHMKPKHDDVCVDGGDTGSPITRLLWSEPGHLGIAWNCFEHEDGTWHCQYGDPRTAPRIDTHRHG